MAEFNNDNDGKDFEFENKRVIEKQQSGLAIVWETLTSKQFRFILVVLVILVSVFIYYISKMFIDSENDGKVNSEINGNKPLIGQNANYKKNKAGELTPTEQEQIYREKEAFNRDLENSGANSQPAFIPQTQELIGVEKKKLLKVTGEEPVDLDSNETPSPKIITGETNMLEGSDSESNTDQNRIEQAILKKLLSRKSTYNPIKFKQQDTKESTNENNIEPISEADSNAEPVESIGITVIAEMENVAAQADMALSTYYPGEAVFTLISADQVINHAKLTGRMVEYTPPALSADPLIQVELDRMCLKDKRCFDISARAFDPETSRFAIASEIDRHWLTRYGFWGLGTMLRAAGSAVQLGSSKTTFTDRFVIQDKSLTAREEFIVGLGILGEEVGSVLSQRLNDPPEVKVNKYDRCGIFFLEPVILQL